VSRSLIRRCIISRNPFRSIPVDASSSRASSHPPRGKAPTKEMASAISTPTSRSAAACPTAAPPGQDAQNGNEIDPALVDHLEFYLLNYFKPGHGQQNDASEEGREAFHKIGCSSCQVTHLTVNHDRRVADLETVYDPVNGVFNSLFATATLIVTKHDGSGQPLLKLPAGGSFVVKDILTDGKRHDPGPNFDERNWDGTLQTQFMTRPLWGVGSTAPHGHDGRLCCPADTPVGCPASIPELARPVPARRSRFHPRSWRSDQAPLPAVRSRQHQAHRAVQQSD
jgi:hypothetical protein